MSRRGAATLELALVLLMFVAVCVGMLDLGLAVLRQHMLGNAARYAARQAIVHGSLASRLGPWGPSSLALKASDSDPLATATASCLPGIDTSKVTIQAAWLDGGNNSTLDNRVQIVLSTSYTPLWSYIIPSSIPLRASSTMVIAH